MTEAALNKKIADYVEQLNTKQKKVVLSVAKAFVEEDAVSDIWEDDAFVKEMDRRSSEFESGKAKGYTWDEAKKISRRALAEVRK